MKINIKTPVFAVVFGLCFSIFSQPVIPNAGFEAWTLDSGQNLNPDYWETLNDTPNVSADQFTPAHTGNYAMRLRPLDFGSFTTPGIAILEFPITGKPGKLTGYIRSNIAGGDEAIIYVMLYHNDSVIASPGDCTFRITDSSSGYKLFELGITYLSNQTPDSCTLVIVAGKFSNPDATTELIVDDLAFQNGLVTDIIPIQAEKNKWKVAPNPATDVIRIQCENFDPACVWQLMDISGNQIEIANGLEVKSEKEIAIQTTNLSTGSYFLRSVSSDGVWCKKVMVLKP
ncbi:MAG: hypothetical protein KG003_13350 [Bacteroidetes bacterium]|nr:hypothetical protein [Bacteroidota bacterium]